MVKSFFKNTDFGVKVELATKRFHKIKIIAIDGRRLLRTVS